jgi:D-glycero-D-manno-heptose 1,7-bisphosphate phosphatase
MVMKAVFLDRDGIINQNDRDYYVWSIEHWRYCEGIFDALGILQNNGFLIFVVSNQGGIAKGLYTKEDTLALHQRMESDFAKAGITITETVFCPHHEDSGSCFCRKPGSLMVERLIAKYRVNPDISWFIGDTPRDREAGIKAGLKTILADGNRSIVSYCLQITEKDETGRS